VEVFKNYWGQLSMNLTRGTSAITGLAWSPDGSILVSVSAGENSAGIIYNANGHALHKFVGSIMGMYELSWSPDGSMFATIGADGTIRIWGVPSD
jgi:WD40 repeat protein